jgi:hypothetical protein
MGGIVVNNEVKLAVAIIAECGVYVPERPKIPSDGGACGPKTRPVAAS